METGAAATPSMLTLRTRNRRERACVFPRGGCQARGHLPRVSLRVMVSLSDIQVMLLTRKETAIYFEAQAASLESKLNSKHQRLGWGGDRVILLFSPLYKTISKTIMEHVCSIYFLFVKGSEI